MRKILLATVASTVFAFAGTAMADSNGNWGDGNDSIDVGDVDVDLSRDYREDYVEVGDVDVDASRDYREDYIETGDIEVDASRNFEVGDVDIDNSTNVETDDVSVDLSRDYRHDYVEADDITLSYDDSLNVRVTVDSFNDVTQNVGRQVSVSTGDTVAVAAYVPLNIDPSVNNLSNIRSIEATAVGSNVANSISVGGISVGNR